MAIIPAGYVNLGQLDTIVKQARELLGPEVLHVAYQIRPDSTDEPSIFFRILLADEAVSEDKIAGVTRRVAEALMNSVRPVEDWGLLPYFNYRSKSEQDRHKDPDWE